MHDDQVHNHALASMQHAHGRQQLVATKLWLANSQDGAVRGSGCNAVAEAVHTPPQLGFVAPTASSSHTHRRQRSNTPHEENTETCFLIHYVDQHIYSSACMPCMLCPRRHAALTRRPFHLQQWLPQVSAPDKSTGRQTCIQPQLQPAHQTTQKRCT